MATKTLTRQVEHCLKHFPETRNSDLTLLHQIWREYYPQRIKVGQSGKEGVWLSDMFDLPREDAVKRIRAKFQNDFGKYLPTSWEVAKQRKINEQKWRLAMDSLELFRT